jgi:hypothetical protein
MQIEESMDSIAQGMRLSLEQNEKSVSEAVGYISGTR